MASKVLLATHFYFTDAGPVYGPPNTIFDYLVYRKRSVLLINYPLVCGCRPFIEKYDGKNVAKKNFGFGLRAPFLLKSLFEVATNLIVGIFYKPDVYVGIDPLNALSGVWLRNLGFVRKTIFYCVDYTPTRFKNKLLNSLYLGTDKYCAKNSDQVWNVSRRIVNLRKKQQVGRERIKFVPNSPSFADCPRRELEKVDRERIVMVSGLTHFLVLDMVIQAFKKVYSKFPKTKLVIIGIGKYRNELIAKVGKMGLGKKVTFLGQLSNKELLNEVSKSGLALAIYSYSKEFSWIYYGDSKKTREYLACGVPVIITNIVAISEDIKKYNAGIVVKPKVEELAGAIGRFLGDKSYWLLCRKNAVKLAKDFDIKEVLDNALGPLI